MKKYSVPIFPPAKNFREHSIRFMEVNTVKHYSRKNFLGGVGERDSSIELLRVVTMICIIMHHYIVNSGIIDEITSANVLSANAIFALIFGWGGKTGINCFVLITGYFMCKSIVNGRKILRILLEIEFYKLVLFIIFSLSGYEVFSYKEMVKMLIPVYSIGTDFSQSYLIFFLFFPYLNLLIRNMNEKNHRYLLMICVCADTFVQTFLMASNAFTYIGWFITLYFIAAYIRKYLDGDYYNEFFTKDLFADKKLWRRLAITTLFLSWGSVVAGSFIYAMTGRRLMYHFVADSNKFFALITSLTVFLYFKNLKLRYSRFINTVAASTFGVLMIHANSDTMRKWLWRDIFNNLNAFNSTLIYFICHALVVVILVYIVCTLIDMVRIKCIEEPFFKCLKKIAGVRVRR